LARITVLIGLFNFAITAAQAQVVLTIANSNSTPEDFSGATYSGSLAGINLISDNLYNADLSRAALINANLSGVYLYYANLSNADLSHAILSDAYLPYANFLGANLTGVTGLGSTDFFGGCTHLR